MRVFPPAIVVAVALFASGCSIHPLPEDVTGLKTLDIVKQIRCEARATVKKRVLEELHTLAAYNPRISLFQHLADKYDSDPDAISTFSYTLFSDKNNKELDNELSQVRNVVKVFYSAGIAYNFELTMTEDNNLTTEVDLLRQIVNPKVALTLSGGASRKRTNARTFTMSDTFGGLLKLPETTYCSGRVVGPNYIYPIAGQIGMDKIINDFIELTLFVPLAGGSNSSGGASPSDASSGGGNQGGAKPAGGAGGANTAGQSGTSAGGATKTGTGSTGTKAGGGKGPSGPPTLTDQLTFTTSLTGTINPVATFTPIGRNLLVSGTNFNALNDRMDTHQVTVAVAIDPSEVADLTSLRTYLFSPARLAAAAAPNMRAASSTSVRVGNRVIGSGTPSEQLALIAIDQYKSREFQIVPAP
jgi:hypothetical protein